VWRELLNSFALIDPIPRRGYEAGIEIDAFLGLSACAVLLSAYDVCLQACKPETKLFEILPSKSFERELAGQRINRRFDRLRKRRREFQPRWTNVVSMSVGVAAPTT
jgi:hypothetical protein